MIRRILLPLALLLAGPLVAAKPIKPGPVTLDPKLGYVLVRIGPAEAKKGRAPDVWLWRYDRVLAELRMPKDKLATAVPKGEDASASFGARPFQIVAGGPSIFLGSLTPGDYVFHGTETTCLCLGSYAFTVRPGEITDIGTVLVARADGTSAEPALAARKTAADIRAFAVPSAMLVRAAEPGDAVPPELRALPITRAELTPDARFLNRGPVRPLYAGGLLVDRAVGLPAPVAGDAAPAVARLTASPEGKAALDESVRQEGDAPPPAPPPPGAATPAPPPAPPTPEAATSRALPSAPRLL